MPLLPAIQKFLLQNWSQIALTLAPFAIYLLLKYWRKQQSSAIHHNKSLHEADLRMVDAAINTGLNDSRAAYLRDYIVPDLAKLTAEGSRARARETWVGLVALICTPISSAITGVGLSIPGVVDTVKFSFFVTSIGSMAAGILIFFGWGAKAINKIELARKIRNEIWQFTAGACEYRDLKIDEAWATLNGTLSLWIDADILADSKAAAKREKVEQATEAGKDGGEGEGEENV